MLGSRAGYRRHRSRRPYSCFPRLAAARSRSVCRRPSATRTAACRSPESVEQLRHDRIATVVADCGSARCLRPVWATGGCARQRSACIRRRRRRRVPSSRPAGRSRRPANRAATATPPASRRSSVPGCTRRGHAETGVRVPAPSGRAQWTRRTTPTRPPPCATASGSAAPSGRRPPPPLPVLPQLVSQRVPPERFTEPGERSGGRVAVPFGNWLRNLPYTSVCRTIAETTAEVGQGRRSSVRRAVALTL